MYDEIFLKHEEELVRYSAQKLVKYRLLLKNKEVTHSEYSELVDDLLDMKHIQEATDDLERRTKMKRAFDTLVMIASLAGGLL